MAIQKLVNKFSKFVLFNSEDYAKMVLNITYD